MKDSEMPIRPAITTSGIIIVNYSATKVYGNRSNIMDSVLLDCLLDTL